MIYGVQYSTDRRDDGRETFKKFRNVELAMKWREEIGKDGRGPSFSSTNGHRYIRDLYKMPPRWHAPKNLTGMTIWRDGKRL